MLCRSCWESKAEVELQVSAETFFLPPEKNMAATISSVLRGFVLVGARKRFSIFQVLSGSFRPFRSTCRQAKATA